MFCTFSAPPRSNKLAGSDIKDRGEKVLFFREDFLRKADRSPTGLHVIRHTSVQAKMRTLFVVLLVVVAGAIASRDLRSCGSCGMECENACGTRNFKTCCFNYMRKRSDMSSGLPLALDPSLRLELWLARSRSPFYQRILQKAANVAGVGTTGYDQNGVYEVETPPQSLNQS